ncbi:MAG TPA: glycosyltransferase family 2 protein [Anaerolineales bacterium]|jgi:glycosyltransferase involved in cell wall biosynthesis|nr:glycosyltransferase family 2 protein [Anaerolineales bacterium]
MPLVSIIVPCYNEQATIRLLLEALYLQSHPRQEMEVVIADGLSTDCTRGEIASFQQEHPDLPIRVVDNPKRAIPAGLNRAIESAWGEILLRLDAHSMPYPDYVARCVSALQRGLGDNVGGVWEILPGGQDWQARGIAAASAHPLGVGDARYRVGGQAQAVDTVPFGAFHRSLVARIGAFDESLLSNEDYEFNARVRSSGGQIWLDPAIRSRYFARPSLSALARQYWRYGYWKARMLRRYPETFRWRQLAGVFVLSFLVLGISGVWFIPGRWLLGLELIVYALALLAVGTQEAFRKRDPALLLGVPLAIATMHFTWGAAFLWSLLTSMFGL